MRTPMFQVLLVARAPCGNVDPRFIRQEHSGRIRFAVRSGVVNVESKVVAQSVHVVPRASSFALMIPSFINPSAMML